MKDMIHIMLKIETFTPFKGLIETSIQSKKKEVVKISGERYDTHNVENRNIHTI